MLNLVKFVAVCPNCNKIYDNTSEPLICTCGETVVSPSGKMYGMFEPIEPVFVIDDGESFWVMAKDKEEAMSFYKDDMGLAGEDCDPDITELNYDDLLNTKLHEEGDPERMSIIEFLVKHKDLDNPPVCIAGTVW
jgi:hypothetical protein